MATVKLDTNGMRCPQPILKITAKMPTLVPGDLLEVAGNCPTFERDVRKWCDRMKKTLLAVTGDGDDKIITIQF